MIEVRGMSYALCVCLVDTVLYTPSCPSSHVANYIGYSIDSREQGWATPAFTPC